MFYMKIFVAQIQYILEIESWLCSVTVQNWIFLIKRTVAKECTGTKFAISWLQYTNRMHPIKYGVSRSFKVINIFLSVWKSKVGCLHI